MAVRVKDWIHSLKHFYFNKLKLSPSQSAGKIKHNLLVSTEFIQVFLWILTQGHIVVDSLEKKIQAVHQGTADLRLEGWTYFSASKVATWSQYVETDQRAKFIWQIWQKGVFFSVSLKLKVNAQSAHCETQRLFLAWGNKIGLKSSCLLYIWSSFNIEF